MLTITPNRLFRSALLLACGLFTLSAVFWHPSHYSSQMFYAAAMSGFAAVWFGLLLMGLAAYGVTWRSVLPVSVPVHTVSLKLTHRLGIVLGLVLLGWTAAASGRFLDAAWINHASHHIQFIVWLTGVVAVTWGMGGGFARRSAITQAGILASELLCIVLLTLTALVMRSWRLDGALQVLVDERLFLNEFLDFWTIPDVPLLAPMVDVAPFPRIYAYWQTWSVDLLGRNFAGLRAVSVVAGTLTVPALWWLTRQIFDRPTALLAAALLVAFPPHIHISRLALNNIADPLFGVLALGFLARGWRYAGRMDFALAGAMLGMTHYFHEAGRLFWLPLVIVWLVWIILFTHIRPQWKHLAVMAFVMIAVASPVYIAQIASPLPLFDRMASAGFPTSYWPDILTDFAGGEKLRFHLWHMLRGPLFLFHTPDQSLYYLGDTALVLWWGVPVVLLGIGWTLWRGLRGVGALPLLWLALMLAGATLLRENQFTIRYTVSFPALCLLAALGLRVTVPALLAGWRSQHLITAIWVFLALAAIGGQAVYYFDRHLPEFNERFRVERPHRDVTDALRRAAQSPPGTQILFFPKVEIDPYWAIALVNFFADGLDVVTIPADNLLADDLRNLDPGPAHLFILDPDDHQTYEAVAAQFDLGPPQFSTNAYVGLDLSYALYASPGAVLSGPVDANPARQHAELGWMFLGLIGLVASAVIWKSGVLWRAVLAAMPRTRPNPILARRLTGAALIVFAVSAAVLAPDHLERAGFGFVLVLVGGVLLGISQWFMPPELAEAGPELPPRPVGQKVLRAAFFGGGMLALTFLSAVNVDAGLAVSVHVQMTCLLAGVLMLVLAVVPYAIFRPQMAHLPLLAITLLAFGLRVINLEYGVHRFVDEVHFVEMINEMRHTPDLPLLAPYSGVPAFTHVYAYWQMIAVEFFGPGLTALRIVSVVMGTLTIPALYFLARQLFDGPTALIAAFFLAVLPPHIHFSRLGLNNIADPLFGTLALAWMVRGVRYSQENDLRWHDFALAGIFLGLTQCFYEGGRLLYPPLLLGGFLLLTVFDRRCGLRTMLKQLAVMVGLTVIVAAPVYLTLWFGGLPSAPRLNLTAQPFAYWDMLFKRGPGGFFERYLIDLRLPAWIWFQHPDASWFYGGHTALLLQPLLVPVFLGIFYMVWRLPRSGAMRLLALWLLAVMAGNSLLIAKWESPRHIIVLPALAILLAIGLWRTLPLLIQQQRRRRWVTLSIAVVLAVVQVGAYFGEHLPTYNRQYPEATIADDLRLRTANLPDYTRVYVLADLVLFDSDAYSILDYMGRGESGISAQILPPEHFEQSGRFSVEPGANYAFFVAPDDLKTINHLLALFPAASLDGPFSSRYPIPEDLQYLLYFLPAGRLSDR